MNTKKALTGLLVLLLCASMLGGCGNKNGTPAAPEAAPAADARNSGAAGEETADGYRFLVTDGNGNPVPGVSVQLCSDTECKLCTTGADGIAAFDDPEGKYTAHILKVPDGFASDNTEYEVPEKFSTVTIVLQSDGSGSSDGVSAGQPANLLTESDHPEVGISMDFPYADKKGSFAISAVSLAVGGATVGIFLYYYLPLEPEKYPEYADYMTNASAAEENGGEIPEAPETRYENDEMISPLFTVCALTGDYGDDAMSLISDMFDGEDYEKTHTLRKLDTKGDTDFFLIEGKAEETPKLKETMADFYDEYQEILADPDTFLSALTFSEPEITEEKKFRIPDTPFLFETTDLDGNPVKLEDIFKDHKVTVVNLWATWCPPCRGELPELAEYAKEWEKLDCQLIGICHDGYEEAKEAKEILKQNGCEYLNLVYTDEMEAMLETGSFPSTFFFDSKGNMIAAPIAGALVNRYPKVLEKCLADMEQ